MRTSLDNIQEIEHYLFKSMDASRAAKFKARLVADPLLRMNVAVQRMVYSLIGAYGRRMVRREIDSAYRNFQNDPMTHRCRREISDLFSNQ